MMISPLSSKKEARRATFEGRTTGLATLTELRRISGRYLPDNNKEEKPMATSADPTVSGRETVSLIGSDKVEGTPVYGRDERKIGMLQRVMIDKISGTVAFAVISFGGFLGIGEDYYPIPWSNLKYDNRVGGYVVGITEEQLKGAPKFSKNTDWDWSNRERDRDVNGYYGSPRSY